MAMKLDKVVTYYKKLQPIKSHNLLKTWSRDKLKTVYLHYHSTYGYKIWQGRYME